MFAGLCLIAHAEPSPESPLESPAEALLQLAGDFSPRYEMVRPHLVVVDIGGLGRLLGTPREIGEAFCRVARERGLIVAIGIASTQTAALLLALHQATIERARHPCPAASPLESVEPAKLADASASAARHARTADRGAAESWTQAYTAAHAHADRLTVVRLGREAAALAPLPLSLLSVLPGDRLTNDDVAFLRRRPDPSSPSSSTSSRRRRSTALARLAAHVTRGAAVVIACATSARGKTRGKRGRGIGAELSSRAVSRRSRRSARMKPCWTCCAGGG